MALLSSIYGTVRNWFWGSSITEWCGVPFEDSDSDGSSLTWDDPNSTLIAYSASAVDTGGPTVNVAWHLGDGSSLSGHPTTTSGYSDTNHYAWASWETFTNVPFFYLEGLGYWTNYLGSSYSIQDSGMGYYEMRKAYYGGYYAEYLNYNTTDPWTTTWTNPHGGYPLLTFANPGYYNWPYSITFSTLTSTWSVIAFTDDTYPLWYCAANDNYLTYDSTNSRWVIFEYSEVTA